MSSIPAPLLVHRVLYSLIAKKLEEVIELPNLLDSMKHLLQGISKKMQIEVTWLCLLETLENVTKTLCDYKAKTSQLHAKNFVRASHAGKSRPAESRQYGRL